MITTLVQHPASPASPALTLAVDGQQNTLVEGLKMANELRQCARSFQVIPQNTGAPAAPAPAAAKKGKGRK